ncbi:helix-turn-helix domain-containing protein [Streptomyces sp. AV19]|uniref:Scr1 family TA system antitoxin-like transcriptional regulator n=1 Tax=Streptomyces sp. AV19 TaxID=2793068 RepID=UPI0018FE5A37|nr:Scr1 family TA system antitoxin-like transcriptional regulator [Streptomyces sp. AV19]MBH1932912.1 helix-turn-helix domain-containing protein [Streptomyces sp. AV19]MDG4531590.1 helix-turn-helix domain-containing protein [Streptomyces sp. AV19]
MKITEQAPAAQAAAVIIIGTCLRRLRARRGWTLQDVAHALGCSISTASRIEDGSVSTDQPVETLLRMHYRVPEEQVRAVVQLLACGSRELEDSGPGWLDRLAVVEQQATVVTTYSACNIPRPLRTPAYDEALDIPGLAFAAPERVPHKLPKGQVYTLFLDEAILLQPVGGPAVMAAQLDHLLDAVQERRAAVRVVPMEAGPVGWDTNLSRLTLHGHRLYVRTTLGAQYTIDSPRHASPDLPLIAAARAALSDDRSHECLEAASERMRLATLGAP